MLVLLSACTTYQRYKLPANRILKIQNTDLTYYVVDAANPISRAWYVSDCQINETGIEGYLTKMEPESAKEIYIVQSRRDSRWSKNDVLFYADPRLANTLPDSGLVNIPVGKMAKIEVYELNHAKTFGTPLLSVTGFLALLYLISGT